MENNTKLLEIVLNEIKELENKMTLKKEFFTMKEACEYLSINKGGMYNAMRNREITYSKPSKIVYFRKEDLDNYAKRNTIPCFADLEGLASDYLMSRQ